MASFELAQINVARLVAPLDDPLVAAFVAGSTRLTLSPRRARASCGGSSRTREMLPILRSIPIR
jgi:hypothetical protein